MRAAAARSEPPRLSLLVAFWLWLLGGIAAGLLSWASGAEISPVAVATALAAAPAVAGFLFFPRLDQRRVCVGLLGVWLLAGIGLAAGTGGAGSPLVVVFLVAPVLAALMGRPWVAESSAAAALAFVLAAGLGGLDPDHGEKLGRYAPILAAFAIVFIGGLLIIGIGSRAKTIAVRREPSAAAERIAEISHEFRTPLTHILGFAEIIETQIFGEIGARNVEYAGLIRSSGRHLLDLVNDLLDLSKLEAGRYELDFALFDANTLVEEAVRLNSESARRKGIVIEARIPAKPQILRADPLALRRMLMNVVANAIKFTPSDGLVRVSVRGDDEKVMFEVADNGPGMTKEERESLGEAYKRGASGAGVEGAGLGLSLVRGLAQAHGGTLTFHEAEEGGALVRITLPVGGPPKL
jgi:signal transduction histidine kinase